jgi:hypothetical protein
MASGPVVPASTGGNDVRAIGRVVLTSPDRVRETHSFNDKGMRALDPIWAARGRNGGNVRAIRWLAGTQNGPRGGRESY